MDNKVNAETDDESAIGLTAKVFGCVGGVAFLTLVINGTLSGPLLTKLHLADSTEDRKRVLKCAEDAVKRRMLSDFIHLMTDRRFYFVDFALVQYHCPLLNNVTAKELEDAVLANKRDVRPSLYKKPNLERVLVYIPNAANLRRTLTRSERDVFMTVEGVGDLTSTEDLGARSISEEGAVAPPSLVQDIRVMFIELLRAAYTAQIRDGELDAREYNGFLSYVLLQSLDFAHDNVMSGGLLNDWTASQLVTPELIDKTEDWFKKFRGCCLQKPKDQQGISARLRTFRDEEPLRYQQLRLDVLRAFSFIDAHREAQDRLNDEFGDGNGEMASAFSIVMEESKAQVKEANDVLRGKKKKRLHHVISHHFCIILQNKAASYIKELLEAGVLMQREGSHYLDQIEHQIIDVRHCPLEKHPGSIDFHEVEDVRDSMTRRKRVKQKSIL